MVTKCFCLHVNSYCYAFSGRIHAAAVTQINLKAHCLTVEWVEKGETKGKEIELDEILELNPEFRIFKSRQENREDCEEEMSVDEDEEDDQYDEENIRSSGENILSERISQQLNVEPSKHIKAKIRMSLQTNQNNREIASKPGNKRATSTNLGSALPSNIRPSTIARSSTNKQIGVANETHITVSSGDVLQRHSGKKKLSCVKEVEKIKQRREERRAAQAAIREHLEQVYDTSAPNWEFEHMIREFRNKIDFTPLNFSEPIVDHQICVCVRKRPVNNREIVQKEIDVVTIPSKDVILVHEPKTKVDLTRYLENHRFRFDYAFDETASNEMVYRYTAKPLVESIFEKGMATCFAYGQTGSGKTHTMGGEFIGKGQQDCTKGIYALAAQDVFKLLTTKYKRLDLVVYASFFEIYSGKVFDLLNNKSRLRVLEDRKQRAQVCGLKEELVSSVEDVFRLVMKGSHERTSGTTSANNQSSRSHAIFQIILKKRGSKNLYGKFSLIDLAGNERGADTMSSDRQTRMEGAEINKSLLALKECIRALSVKGAHLPFRVSQLTQVLKDSFTGENSRTCMIAMISPGMSCCEHTLNTLRYADRVKELGPGDPIDFKENDEDRDWNINGSGIKAVVSVNPEHISEEEELEDEEVDDIGIGDEEDARSKEQSASELAMLQSANEEEVTDELLDFHKAVVQLQNQEDQLIEAHSLLDKEEDEWRELSKKLFKMTEAPGYDVEAYATKLIELTRRKIEKLTDFGDMSQRYLENLQYEESLSKNIVASKARKQLGKN